MSAVTQIGNLLALDLLGGAADCQSAVPQVANLRYDFTIRLQG